MKTICKLSKYTFIFSFLFFSSILFAQESTRIVPITGNLAELNNFFTSLESTNTKKIRIAHYGDSIIWGDVITADLRRNFQNNYGGSGLGYLSLCRDDEKSSTTAVHTFSDDWSWGSLFTKNTEKYPIDISGASSVAGNNSWVKYSMRSKNMNKFKEVKLFYGKPNGGSKVKADFAGKGNGEYSLKSEDANLNMIEFAADEETSSLELNFGNTGGIYGYGVSLENGPGVYVDNFALRGNTGVSLLEIDENLMKRYNEELNYSLIILSFGLNIASAEKVNYKWYYNKMKKVVEYFKTNFPKASILLVGASDRGIKEGSKFISDPAVINLIKVQERIAEKTNIAFWNMFEAMGGKNSIIEWVEGNPALAHKDYCHLNDFGGKRMADLLYNSLMDSYKNYKGN